jgi:hypothetical protein
MNGEKLPTNLYKRGSTNQSATAVLMASLVKMRSVFNNYPALRGNFCKRGTIKSKFLAGPAITISIGWQKSFFTTKNSIANAYFSNS